MNGNPPFSVYIFFSVGACTELLPSPELSLIKTTYNMVGEKIPIRW